jgi:transcriptional regulator with XRE-family HTH domain
MQEQLVGPSLRALRKERGLTQAQLGTEVGVTGSAVGQWEQGRTTPSWQQLQKLAEFFGVEAPPDHTWNPHNGDTTADLIARMERFMAFAQERRADIDEMLAEQKRLNLAAVKVTETLADVLRELRTQREAVGRIDKFVQWREADLAHTRGAPEQ